MSRSLRAEFGRYASSVEAVRADVGLDRPVSVQAVWEAFGRPVAMDAPIVTPSGTALGGHHWLELSRDGTYRYREYMRATAWPSFTFVVNTTAQGPDGPPAAMIAQGAVHGTNERGNRESSWDQRGTSALVAEHWLPFRRAGWTFNVWWNSDWVGVLDDWVAGLVMAATATALGSPVGLAIVLGSRLEEALDTPGLALPQLAGVVVAGTGVLVCGPGALIPALQAGIVTGIIVAAAISHQPPTTEQKEFAWKVFHDSISWEKIELTNLLGFGRRPFVMPTNSGTILVNLGAGFDDPTGYTGHGDADTDGSKTVDPAGTLFIHELTHVWQIQNGRFLPGWLCDAIGAQWQGASAYNVGGTRDNWDDFNIEQRAKIVEQWFGGKTVNEPQTPMLESDADRYWRYIRGNIRGGNT